MFYLKENRERIRGTKNFLGRERSAIEPMTNSFRVHEYYCPRIVAKIFKFKPTVILAKQMKLTIKMLKNQ